MEDVVDGAEVWELDSAPTRHGHWDRDRSIAERGEWPTAADAVRWGRGRAPRVWLRVGSATFSAGEVVALDAPCWGHAGSLGDAQRETDYGGEVWVTLDVMPPSPRVERAVPKLIRTRGPWVARIDVEPLPE